MLAVWIVTATDDSSGFSLISTVPAKSENRPRVFDTITWRTANPTWLWLGSRAYEPAAGTSSPSTTRTAGLAMGVVVRVMAILRFRNLNLLLQLLCVQLIVDHNYCAGKFYSGYLG